MLGILDDLVGSMRPGRRTLATGWAWGGWILDIGFPAFTGILVPPERHGIVNVLACRALRVWLAEDSVVSIIGLPLCDIPGMTLRDQFFTMGLGLRINLISRRDFFFLCTSDLVKVLYLLYPQAKLGFLKVL